MSSASNVAGSPVTHASLLRSIGWAHYLMDTEPAAAISIAKLGDTIMSLEDIREDFQFLDNWEDRYRYVIELGRQLAPFPEDDRTDANKVRGCVSQVWLKTDIDRPNPGAGDRLTFVGDSDALIVKGLIAILLEIYNGKSASELLAIDAEAILSELGLHEHLTPQRSNGLSAMVARMRRDAEATISTP